MLPESLHPACASSCRARAWWLKRPVPRAAAAVALPDALERKYPRRAFLAVVLVFAQHTHSTDPRSGVVRRHRMYDQTFQRAFKRAVEQSRHHEARHTAHPPPLFWRRPCSAAVTTFEPQDLLGHSDVSTTMIYTHAESWRCRSATA